MDYYQKEVKDIVEYFSFHFKEGEVDPLTILAVALPYMVKEKISFSSLEKYDEFHGSIISYWIKERLKKAKKAIEEPKWIFIDIIGEYAAWKKGEPNDGYESALFLRAIETLRNKGMPVYITNHKQWKKEIWAEYFK